MKKLVLTIIIVLMSSMAWCATAVDTINPVMLEAGNGYVKFKYSSTNNVAVGVAEAFKLKTRGVSGTIREFYFESTTSTDCDVHLAEEDNVLSTDSSTILAITGINIGYSPELAMPRVFVNRDSTQENSLYLTIDPDVGATGNWNCIITFDRF